jgi:hypothetical protein
MTQTRPYEYQRFQDAKRCRQACAKSALFHKAHVDIFRDCCNATTLARGFEVAASHLVRCSKRTLLDHLVGEREQRRGNFKAISDETLSPETGNGTEFVVLLSGEPQGSMKIRRRGRGIEFRY